MTKVAIGGREFCLMEYRFYRMDWKRRSEKQMRIKNWGGGKHRSGKRGRRMQGWKTYGKPNVVLKL